MADEPRPSVAYLGLGGNMGDVRAALTWALFEISQLPDTELIAVSPLYETPPWGITSQSWFLNACVGVETRLSPHALLRAVIDIEKRAGRVRDMRWGPRTLDIDVLLYDRVAIRTPDLTVPHPRMMERAFVMVPLNDIASDAMVGTSSVSALAKRVDRAGMRVAATDWSTV
ncbi:MAG: 2-amino-4-hydroxy-6-hydroxymethyldihydropteridine diphosphokinase [Pseudomonadota bacterium]